jgi:hypothetical protein
MSVVSRILLAGVVAVSLGVQAAPTVARAQGAADDASKGERDRLLHASKCVLTFGFGCDSGAPPAKGGDKPADKGGAEVTKASDDHSTRAQVFHASKCVVSFGFAGGCDKDAPARPSSAAAPAAPDTSTRGRLLHAARCVGSLGLIGDCDKGDAH